MASIEREIINEEEAAIRLKRIRRKESLQRTVGRVQLCLREAKRLYFNFHHSRSGPGIQISTGAALAVCSRAIIPVTSSWWLWQLRTYGLVIGIAWLGIGIYNFLMRIDLEDGR